MRFGRDLHCHQIPEWSSSYLDYNSLKKEIKLQSKGLTDDEENGLGKKVRGQLQKVEEFFLRKFELIEGRAGIEASNYGQETWGYDASNSTNLEPREVRDVLGGLLEVSEELRKLAWWCKVNRDGFVCLLRKLTALGEGYAKWIVLEEYRFAREDTFNYRLEQLGMSIDILKCQDANEGKHGAPERGYLTNGFPKSRAFARAVEADSEDALAAALREYNARSSDYRKDMQLVHLAVLHVSVTLGSRKCISHLLHRMDSVQNNRVSSKQNCIHRLVIATGRNAAFEKEFPTTPDFALPMTPVADREVNLSLLTFLLDEVRGDQIEALFEKDNFGRTPLHYAAQYGLEDICSALIRRMRKWRTLPLVENRQITWLRDVEGNTPMHLAIQYGHSPVLSKMLDFQTHWGQTLHDREGAVFEEVLGTLLDIAVRSKCSDIVIILLKHPRTRVIYTQTHGETALFCAARSGKLDIVRVLIEAHTKQQVDLNTAESTFGWTPLMVATVNNHISVFEALLQAGAKTKHRDAYGWTAKHYAAFRAQWVIEQQLPASCLKPPSSKIKPVSDSIKSSKKIISGESKIFVNLGTLNTRDPKEPVDLSDYLASMGPSKYPRTEFSVEVKAIDACSTTAHFNLPVLEDTTNTPITFTAKDPSKVKLIFTIYETMAHSPKHLKRQDRSGPYVLGRAIAVLKNLKDGFGVDRESFSRNFTVPIHGNYGMEYIGTVTFNFLTVTPFEHPHMTDSVPQTIWAAGEPTQIVGHRGFGQNNPACKRLQIGENTIQSFMSTIALGVNFIECDVQLTRDHVPIIYHDFLVSESGADLAPYNLSLDQFMHINEIQTPQSGNLSIFEERLLASTSGSGNTTPCRPRSRSVDLIEHGRNRDFVARMRKTHEYRLKGFKGNTRGDHIHDPFATLVELLHNIPEDVGIALELKYPMLFETEDWKMDPYGIEINLFLDTILTVIALHGGNRPMILASFCPEICILASLKQSKYPVMFLSESGLYPTGDVRASNLQQAVAFAVKWGMQGVIVESTPFVSAEGLVGYVKGKGLGCSSWGSANDDPEHAKVQAKAGLDAIIVDAVRLIANTLNVPKP